MEIETERLRMRHYALEDAEGQLRILSDPEFRRRLRPQPLPTRDMVLVGFGRAGLARVMAVTDKENKGSRRVMEKCGLRYERDDFYYGVPVVYYALNREDYEPDGSPHLERE